MSDEKRKFSEKEKEASKSSQIFPENYGQQYAGPYEQPSLGPPPPNFGGGMPPYAQQPQQPPIAPHGQQPPFGQQAPYGQPPFGHFDQQQQQQPPTPFGVYDQHQQPYGGFDQKYPPFLNNQGPLGQQPPFMNQVPFGQQPPFMNQVPFGQQPPFMNQVPFGQQPPFMNQGPPGPQAPYGQPPFGAFDQQQVPQMYYDQGPPGPYGQFPPFDPQAQMYPSDGFPDPNGLGQFPPPDPAAFSQPQPASDAVNPAEAPKFFQATEEQLLEYRDKLREKFRHTLPFDWLGQADNQWYSSWCMKQENFFAFRLGLALYAYWAWEKFRGQIGGDSWTGDLEFYFDPTSIIRAGVTWFSLLSVFLGILGVTIFSGLQLILSEKTFSALSSYRLHSTRTGKILNWLVFGMNFHYDAAPITACMALVLTITPNNFYQIKLAQPLWPALTLPLLVLMDLWLVKRCRIDSTYIRRNIFLMISFVGLVAYIWTYYFYYAFRGVFRIYTTKSFVAELAPTLVLALAYVIVAVIGTDSVYNFIRFKSYFLITNHFDKIAARDVNKILGETEEKYNLKREKFRLQMEAEQAKYMADLAAQFNKEDNNAAYEDNVTAAGDSAIAGTSTAGTTVDSAEEYVQVTENTIKQ